MRPERRIARCALGVALSALAVSSPASAEPTDPDKALATTLFNEGKTLLAEGKASEACRKLEESRRLDPLPGTILNLAVCHEAEGLMASALAEFREARVLAQRDHRDDRVAFAEQHLQAIEPKVSKLIIVVGPGADLPALRISRDGTPLGRAAWGTRIPVDPGEHVIEASAPNKKTARVSVRVLGDGDVQTAALTPLDDEPSTPTETGRPVVPASSVDARAEVSPDKAHEPLSMRRKIALVSAGLGVVGAGVGSYAGLVAIQRHGDPGAKCATAPCSDASVHLNNEAKTAADVSTVSFVAGLVGLGIGAFLWFGDTSGRADKAAGVGFVPILGTGRAGVDVSGRF